jgi:hypothetical protein
MPFFVISANPGSSPGQTPESSPAQSRIQMLINILDSGFHQTTFYEAIKSDCIKNFEKKKNILAHPLGIRWD